MTPEEIKKKWQACHFETQAEFERMMTAINNEQTLVNAPFIDAENTYAQELENLKMRIAALRITHLQTLQKQKEINRAYHTVKHELIVMNPKCCLQPGTMPKEKEE